MTTSTLPESEDSTDPVVTETPAPAATPASAHPDPITGEPGAHPVGVGVGALGAGAAGAAIGAIGGPIGMLIGAAIGAVAGGLAGKEVAASNEAPTVPDEPASSNETSATVPAEATMPISMASVPGEGLRAMSGLGFSDDASFPATGTVGLSSAAPVEVEDDELPTPSHASMPVENVFQAPMMPESELLAGTSMPGSGEESVKVSAYYHYLSRAATGASGDALSDWLEAEREMMLS